jgi:hypothetical protein
MLASALGDGQVELVLGLVARMSEQALGARLPEIATRFLGDEATARSFGLAVLVDRNRDPRSRIVSHVIDHGDSRTTPQSGCQPRVKHDEGEA